jgi:hypothetical protein
MLVPNDGSLPAALIWTPAPDSDKTHWGNIIERQAGMITWQIATILILVAYILGLMTAIRLLKS